jgi:hypothetical protein
VANNGIGFGFDWAVKSMTTKMTQDAKKAARIVAQPQVIGQGTGRCGTMLKKIKEKCTSPRTLRVLGALKTFTTFG